MIDCWQIHLATEIVLAEVGLFALVITSNTIRFYCVERFQGEPSEVIHDVQVVRLPWGARLGTYEALS
jgi:hypothetical protein